MERIKFKGRFLIHPLFLIFGVYYAFTGRLFVFLTYTVVAVMHEFAHAFSAAKVGYKLKKIVLMPYGAVISGDMEGISFKDEISVALAGPLVNALTALIFVAVWWLFPDLYPFTDTAMLASLSIAIVNLLPAFPLDGGRVLFCAIAKSKGEKKARKICRAVSLFIGLLTLALFVYSCFNEINFSILFFSSFIIVGAFSKNSGTYKKIKFDITKTLEKGAEIKRIALLDSAKVKRVLSFIERGKILEICVYNKDGELLKILNENEILSILESENLYSSLSDSQILQKSVKKPQK